MPDDVPHADADDISDLWGPDQRGALDPLWPAPPARDKNSSDLAAVNGNGSHGGRAASHDELAKLVEAIAAHQIGGPSRAELDAVSERITAVQDDVRALHEAVAELTKAVDRQGRRSRARPWGGDRSERSQG